MWSDCRVVAEEAGELDTGHSRWGQGEKGGGRGEGGGEKRELFDKNFFNLF